MVYTTPRMKKWIISMMVALMMVTLVLPAGIAPKALAASDPVVLAKWDHFGAAPAINFHPTDGLSDNSEFELRKAGEQVTYTTPASPIRDKTSLSAVNWQVGEYWTTSFHASGYKEITVSSRQYSSGTGPKHYALQYRIDNGAWADVPSGSIVVGNANWESGGSLTVSLPADADGQALVSLRWLLVSDESARNAAGNNEKISASGTNRIYNVVISGTPQGETTDPVTSKPVASKIIFSDTGAVTGLSGAVAGLADVKLYDAQSSLVGGVTANEDGSFQAVVTRDIGTQVWVTATEPDKAESSKVEAAIAVTAAPELSLITFNGEAAEITGLAGAVEANASVIAYWDNQTLAGSIRAEANGSFRLKLTDAGQHTFVQLAAKNPDKLESAKKQLSLVANPQPQEVKPGDVVISQLYIAGGNSGAIFKTKFVELYNSTDHDIDLTGWSVQYAARTGNFGTGNTAYKKLEGLIKAHSYYLVTGSSGENGRELPVQTDLVSGLNPSQTAGKIALSKSSAALSGKADVQAMDFVTWADAQTNLPNDFWGSPIVAPVDLAVEAFKKGTLLRKSAGGDPREVTGAGNGVFTKDSGADFVIHIAADSTNPAETIKVRNSQAAAEPMLITNAPVSSLIQLRQDAQQTVVGVAGAVDGRAVVQIYAVSGGTLVPIGNGTAGSDGSFETNVIYPNQLESVYIAARSGTYSLSRLVRVDAAGFDAAANPLPIAELRVNDDKGMPINSGARLKVSGVVTAGKGEVGAQNLYLQDASGGIQVVVPVGNNTAFSRGDSLTVTGTVQFINGTTSLVADVLTKEDGSQPIPEPQTVHVQDLLNYAKAERLEGQLAVLYGKVTSITEQPDAYRIAISDETASAKAIVIAKSSGLPVRDKLQVGSTYRFTGLVGQYKTFAPYTAGYELYPRSLTDIVGALELIHVPVTSGHTETDLLFEAKANNADSVIFYYRAAGATGTSYTALPMTQDAAGVYKALLAQAAVPGEQFDYYIEARSADQTRRAGTPEEPIHIVLIADSEGPLYTDELPLKNAKVENNRPEISIKAYDPSGVNPASIRFTLDGAVISASYEESTGRITANVQADLAVGAHVAEIYAKDLKGNESSFSWSFDTLAAFVGGNHYRGTTHNHTGISHDAKGEPAEAVAAAKKQGYDWFAFTDHSHDIDKDSRGSDTVDHGGMPERTGSPDLSTSQWQKLKNASKENTVNGQFVAMLSYEMTSTVWGHSNIFGMDNFIDRIQDNGIYQNLNNFYKWAGTHTDIVAQFNHPNWGGTTPPFNSFLPYNKDINKLFTMFEVGNGSGQYTYSNIEDLYFRTLDLGWHVAPTFGEDHHNGQWGETMRRTVIVAEELTTEALQHSMRNMRVYMSESPHFTLDVLANGSYMGSTVDSQSLNFKISGKDEGGAYTYLPPGFVPNERIKSVELITNGTVVQASITPTANPSYFSADGKSFDWTPTLDAKGGQQWFVVKVTQMDGSRTYSSPIWSKEMDVDVKIQGIEAVGSSVIADNPADIEALIGNFGVEQLNNLKVAFYYDEAIPAKLIGETVISSLPTKSTARAKVTWSKPIGGKHKLIAVITNPPAGNPVSNNRYETELDVKEPFGITIMIDASHGNENTSEDTGTYKDNLVSLTKLLRNERYTVIENKTALTSDVLEDVSVLMISQPNASKPYSEAEINALSAFVAGGGSVVLTGKSNNSANSQMNNTLLAQLGSVIQFNNDGVYDGSKEGNFWSNPSASLWSVRSHPEPTRDYMTDFVRKVDYYSGASLMGLNKQALTNTDKVTILASGNVTSYQFNLKDGGFDYQAQAGADNGAVMPLIASEQIGKGRVIVSGMNVFNDRQLDLTEQNNDNVRLSKQVFNWLAGRGTKVLSMAEARKQPVDTDIVVEGKVTSAAGVFFDAFYIQDETGGIMAFNEVPADSLQLGDTVRVYGHVKIFENNLEIMFDNFDKNVLKLNKEPEQAVQPKAIKTGQAASDNVQGLLVKLTGKVTRLANIPDHTIYVDDGSGEALVFIDGYIANQSGQPPELKVGDTLEAIGLAGQFSGGYWIRVRDTKELKRVEGGTDPGNGGTDPGNGGTDPGNGGTNPGNGGNNPGNGGGSKPDDSNVYHVPADKLSGNAADSVLKVPVPAQATEVVLPGQTLELLKERNLEIQKDNVSIVIPNRVLRQLTSKVADSQLAAAQISLSLIPLGDDEAKKLARGAESTNRSVIQLAGQVYELSLSITAGGKSEKLTQFETPLTIAFRIPQSMSSKLLGIYYVADNGKLEYVGGQIKDGMITAQVYHFSKYALLEVIRTFNDVAPSHWAYGVIGTMASRQVVTGISDTQFEPNRDITRAEFTALLVRALNLKDKSAIAFQDVSANAWYAEPIAIAYKAGLIKGKNETSFDPNGRITREEMAVILAAAYELSHSAGLNGQPAVFADAGKIAPWAVNAIRTASQAGLLQGRNGNMFAPKGLSSRAEAVQAIYNLLSKN
ncbi:S-layer homology domain-containing protein [Paenibacillus radicis (ex Gao et al. 2016)]|uniref:Uncharacterized protein n=1 Tax=Paenibacillus radicis (ex Gao et al. 2016) TaxID=1737354 RepID=A0A917GXC3_9BACL|nr:S-layer homology domain-containing protein [Paenibacillus radicis (ex Gao et al. 2016)]GGG60401.1 hypothetical protein GCM10010918_12080 [Paenibacillus radicis (ex Gao et al. 2016)]